MPARDAIARAVDAFGRSAEAYERGRPEHSAEAVRHLARVLALGPGRTVLDLGAGTGKFTRALEPTGARLLALEPTAGMRAEFARRLPSVPLVDGTAEAIGLPAASVDAVVAAQAFHWFDPIPAAREIARVLVPSGGLGLLWNLRDESVPWVAALTRLMDAHDPGVPRGRARAWKAPLESTGLFSPLESAEFRHVQRADRATMLDRVLSVSFIAALSDSEQAQVADEVRELLDREEGTRGRDVVELPYRTEVYWAHRA